MEVIRIENISKLYRLGQIGRKTISEDLKRWMSKLRGNEDPFLQVGALNDKTQKDSSGFVWALKDISFSIQQGDIVGIIGKNGAGKSTLLKILSGITSPTTGEISIKGRIGSLLEVGTGFHPELTGRENIYLNGTILGMTKKEITRKLDEIIAFSGVEKYIDTPVKRYSSGMMVRLGFAVAAHLEPEILIVDEVLAVGDIEFQKKCLGKMQEVSNEGRTILFVSHNMGAVESLCKSGVVLHNGTFSFSGSAKECVNEYLKKQSSAIVTEKEWTENDIPGNEFARIYSAKIYSENKAEITINSPLIFEIEYYLNSDIQGRVDLSMEVTDDSGNTMFLVGSGMKNSEEVINVKGRYNFKFRFINPLNVGLYQITLRINHNRSQMALVRIDDILNFEVKAPDVSNFKPRKGYMVPSFEISKLLVNDSR